MLYGKKKNKHPLEKKVLLDEDTVDTKYRTSSRRSDKNAREAAVAKLVFASLLLLLGGSLVIPSIMNALSQVGSGLNDFKNGMIHLDVQFANPKLPKTPSNIGNPKSMTMAQVYRASSSALQNPNDTTPEIIITDNATLTPKHGKAEIDFTLQLDVSNPNSQQKGDLFRDEKTGQEIFIPDSKQASEIVSDLGQGKTVNLSGLDGELLTSQTPDGTRFGDVFFALPDNLQIGTAKVSIGRRTPAEGEIAYLILAPFINSRRMI